MPFKSILKEVDKLKAEFEALKPLKKEDEDRLWKKFRLDWNYNSNHIEGNTLTYAETELLIIFDRTTGEHTMREYEEMQAHDVTIRLVQEAAEEKERPLNEPFIRQLNEILLVKPFYKAAKTPDGQSTRRKIIPGEYKKHPNSVVLENGEEFHYASPQEVPILMGDLISSYTNAVAEGKHPIEIAAMLHYKFVRIHPFDDGNGRVARLLMNYVLLYHGYQPAIIKSDAKKEYLTALNKTDVLNAEINDINKIEPFAEYIANQLLWSYEVSIKASKGESINEPGDFEKRIKNLKHKLFVSNDSLELKKHYIKNTFNTFKEITQSEIIPSLLFDSVGYSYTIFFSVQNDNRSIGISSGIEAIENDINKKIEAGFIDNDFSLELKYLMSSFKELGLANSFDFVISVEIKFENNKPSVNIRGNNVGKGYDQFASFEVIKSEWSTLIEKSFDGIIKDIENKINK